MLYNWQQADWPEFRYDLDAVEGELLAFADKAGQVAGLFRALPGVEQNEALADLLISEAIKTSEIEGEFLSRPDVTSSVRNQLGLNATTTPVQDLKSAGAAELGIKVRGSWDEPLSEERLFDWHRTLFQGARLRDMGCWRTHESPMQVISPRIGEPVVHFEAPPSVQVQKEMLQYLQWFNSTRKTIKQAPIRAALAHLYFESIHPFEDGNGRIGRAIAEKALSQGLGRPVLLSLSRVIEGKRSAYYGALKEAQGSNEVTKWIVYFVKTLLEAQREAEALVDFVLRKTRFFDRFREQLNDRQLKVVRRLLNAGPDGFEGGINARKYKNLTEVSKATATRDLQDLSTKDILRAIGAGRSARYELNL